MHTTLDHFSSEKASHVAILAQAVLLSRRQVRQFKEAVEHYYFLWKQAVRGCHTVAAGGGALLFPFGHTVAAGGGALPFLILLLRELKPGQSRF